MGLLKYWYRWTTRWAIYLYGKPDAPYQALFYRCMECKTLITWWQIKRTGCACGANRMAPTNPRLWEEFGLVIGLWRLR